MSQTTFIIEISPERFEKKISLRLILTFYNYFVMRSLYVEFVQEIPNLPYHKLIYYLSQSYKCFTVTIFSHFLIITKFYPK